MCCRVQNHKWAKVDPRNWEMGQLKDALNVLKYQIPLSAGLLLARLESAYSLIWGAHRIWGEGGGKSLALL